MLWSFNSDNMFLFYSFSRLPTYLKVWSRTNIDLEAESGTALHRNYKKSNHFLFYKSDHDFILVLTYNPSTLTDSYIYITRLEQQKTAKQILCLFHLQYMYCWFYFHWKII